MYIRVCIYMYIHKALQCQRNCADEGQKLETAFKMVCICIVNLLVPECMYVVNQCTRVCVLASYIHCVAQCVHVSECGCGMVLI